MSNQVRDQQPEDTFDLADKIKLGVATAALVVLVLFFVVNFETVEVDLIVVSPDLPLAAALVASALLGFVVGTVRPRPKKR